MALGGECGVVVGRFGIVDGRGEVDRLNFNSETIDKVGGSGGDRGTEMYWRVVFVVTRIVNGTRRVEIVLF